MAEILSRDDICNYFDLVGNHDDPDLYLFVKTAEHLCSLSYYCRLPTGMSGHIGSLLIDRAPDKMRVVISIISSPNLIFDHLLKSSH